MRLKPGCRLRRPTTALVARCLHNGRCDAHLDQLHRRREGPDRRRLNSSCDQSGALQAFEFQLPRPFGRASFSPREEATARAGHSLPPGFLTAGKEPYRDVPPGEQERGIVGRIPGILLVGRLRGFLRCHESVA